MMVVENLKMGRVASAMCLGAVLVLGACSAPDEAADSASDAMSDADHGEMAAVEPMDEASHDEPMLDQGRAPTLSHSVHVAASAADAWALIGGFCAVSDWHPVVGTCTTDGATPPTRTLVTVDGSATFVEQETARDDAGFSYSYAIMSGPLPVSDYVGTLSVADDADGGSTITWSSVYVAVDGQDDAAAGALTGIYESGLAAVAIELAD
jgi:hypothetical protein